jgi:hypothetical protein
MGCYSFYGELVVIPELMPETTSAVDPYTGVGTLPREYRQTTAFSRGAPRSSIAHSASQAECRRPEVTAGK